MKKRLEATEMRFTKESREIRCTEHLSNEDVLKRMEIKRTHKQNQKVTVEMSGTYDEERKLEEFDTHSTCSR